MKRHVAHWTRSLQWALVVSVGAALGVIAFGIAGSTRADTMYITLGELRSRAAELREITHQASAERLTATFTRAQGRQLEQRVASLRDDLDKARRGRPSDDVGAAQELVQAVVWLGGRKAVHGARWRAQARRVAVLAIDRLEDAAAFLVERVFENQRQPRVRLRIDVGR